MGDLSRWLLLGAIVAIPIAWTVVQNWLQNFAFRIDLLKHWYLFALAILLAGLVGSLAMIYQSMLAARANPVDSLRT